MTRQTITTVICLLMLLFSGSLPAASIEARLDRARVAEGETVVLMLTVPGGSTGTPDLSPLATDFDILSHSQSMHMSMVNGRSSSSRGWQFVLAPKRTGKLSVPEIRVDGKTTRPLTLEVLPAAQAAQLGPAPPVMLEVDAEPKQPYVQQKVIYTVRLLSRAPLHKPVVSEPRVRDAIIEPLGRETEYSSPRHGQQYRVVERRYAVFPQHSGALEIDGPTLTAQLPEPGQPPMGPGRRSPGRDVIAEFDRRFGFPGTRSSFAQTRPIQLRAQNLVIDVQAQPAGAASPWLPAESLALNDTWSTEPPVFRVGEPITRTLAISALGLSPAQLPDLALPVPAGIKAYPDKSTSQVRVDGDTLVAQKRIQTALVPSQAGGVTLPEIALTWWDTARGQVQVARLPARSIEVLPATGGSAVAGNNARAPLVSPAPGGRGFAGQALPDAAAMAAKYDSGGDRGMAGGYWPWVGPWVAALLGLAWLVTLGLWLRTRYWGAGAAGAPAVPKATTPTPPLRSTGAVMARLEQACRSGDATAARKALLDWGVARWPEDPPRRLDAFAQRLGDEAGQVLAELDRQLYSNGPQSWDGAAAWQSLSPLLAKHSQADKRPRQGSTLPPLYPEGA